MLDGPQPSLALCGGHRAQPAAAKPGVAQGGGGDPLPRGDRGSQPFTEPRAAVDGAARPAAQTTALPHRWPWQAGSHRPGKGTPCQRSAQSTVPVCREDGGWPPGGQLGSRPSRTGGGLGRGGQGRGPTCLVHHGGERRADGGLAPLHCPDVMVRPVQGRREDLEELVGKHGFDPDVLQGTRAELGDSGTQGLGDATTAARTGRRRGL